MKKRKDRRSFTCSLRSLLRLKDGYAVGGNFIVTLVCVVVKYMIEKLVTVPCYEVLDGYVVCLELVSV